MIISSTLIFCLIPELKSRLSSGRIHKVKESEHGRELVFSVKKENKFVHLFYSSDPVNCRAELRGQRDFQTVKDKFSDSRLFQAILRAEIKRIEQIDFDRVIRITLMKRTELEGAKELDLVFELTGRNTNVILLDKKEGIILDCLKKIGPARSRYRQIAPGLRYVLPPPPRKKNPLEIEEEELKESLSHKPEANISSFLLDSFSGIDKLLAQKITLDSSIPLETKISELTDAQKENVVRSFLDTFHNVKTHRINPHTIYDQASNPVAISVFDLSFIPKEQKARHGTLSMAIKEFFKLKTQADELISISKNLSKQVTKGRRALEGLLAKLKEDLKTAERYQEYKEIADLLMINKHRVKKGQKTLRVKDVFHPDEKTLNIKLNPVFSAWQNAKLYYKKYTKAKDSLSIVRERITEIEQKLKMLQRTSEDLEANGLDAAREKLAALGFYKKPRGTKKKERPKKKLSPREFVTSDGWKILVGRNSKENDYLTFKIAKPYDFWFHAQDAGGSHLVLRRENRNQQPSTKTLIQAAKIAAYFSQARSSKKVSVTYTLVKHVRKPKKAKPGLVTVQKEKTIIVAPGLPA